MSNINLSKLPGPVLIAEQTVEEIQDQRLTALQSEGVEINNFTPSDPVYRNILAASHREKLVVQNTNEQARGVLLAFASNVNLDHIGNFPMYQLERLQGESDEAYQQRILLSPEAASAAGPAGRYELAALTASVEVKGAKFLSPEPMIGNVYVLSRENTGAASAELLDTVETRITSDEVRAQGDVITALSATILHYVIDAELVIADGPDKAQVLATATGQLQRYVDEQHRLGGQVVEFKVNSALDIEGVEDVILNNFSELRCNKSQAPYCDAIQLVALP